MTQHAAAQEVAAALACIIPVLGEEPRLVDAVVSADDVTTVVLNAA